MISKEHKDRIDQLMEDTFPTGAIPSARGEVRGEKSSPPLTSALNHLPSHPLPPNGAQVGAGTTTEASVSNFTGAASALAAPVSDQGSTESRPTLPRAEQIQDLGKLCERMKLLGEELERNWQAIIAAQQQLGWPDFHLVQGITHDLHRTTAELDGRTFEMVCKLRWRPASPERTE